MCSLDDGGAAAQPPVGVTRALRATVLAAALTALAGAGCGSQDTDPVGIRRTPAGTGPEVVFDPLTEPTPDIPIPNDLATFVDPTSPTGRRVNIRMLASTSLETKIRESVDGLDGFGTFAPLTIPFSAPIDLDTADGDGIVLVDIDPDSPRAGQRIPLDLAINSYPVEFTPWAFPPYDPQNGARQILYDTAYGDAGDEGFVDYYEHATNTLIVKPLVPLRETTEYAAVLTESLRGLDGEPVRSPFTYVNHAVQTETLERAWPYLEQAGVSPDEVAFAWTFTTQSVTRDLVALADGLQGEGPFGWLPETYPPEIVAMNDMETQLDRLFCGQEAYADNPCRDNTYILQAEMLDTFLEPILSVPGSGDLVSSFAQLLLNVNLGEDINMSLRLDAVDYIVFGRFRSPELRGAGDEVFHLDHESGEAESRESSVPFIITVPKPQPGMQQPFPVIVHAHGLPSFRWEILTLANEWAKHGYATVSMDNVNHSPIISTKDVEILVGSILDQVEGGLCDVLPDPFCSDVVRNSLDGVGEPLINAVRCVLFGDCGGEGEDGPTQSFQEALDQLLSTGLLRELLVEGRAVDIDGDGNTDHGYLFALDLFQSRDRVRQTVVDHMQLMRMLRGLDQSAVPPAVPDPARASPEELLPNLMAGDFDADGVLDLGGAFTYVRGTDGIPDERVGPQRFFRTGFSMGGILGSILMAVEPDTPAAGLAVPGGGLAADALLRVDLRPVVDPLFHELLGPVLVGEPLEDRPGTVALSWVVRRKVDRLDFSDPDTSLVDNVFPLPVGELRVFDGGTVRLRNDRNGELESTPIVAGRPFSEAVASDAGDPVVIESLGPDGQVLDSVLATAPTTGLGIDRNSVDFRRFVMLGQVAMEPADPINYGPHWFLDPLPGRPPKSMLIESIPGDTFVPVNTQVALARAAGLFGSDTNECDGVPATLEACGTDLVSDCDCVNLALADNRVMLGFDRPPEAPRYDVDDLTTCSGIGPLPSIPTGAGQSAVRFPFASTPITEADGTRVNKGQHWFMAFSDFTIPLNWAIYTQNQIATFFDQEGQAPPLDCACPAVNENCELVGEP